MNFSLPRHRGTEDSGKKVCSGSLEVNLRGGFKVARLQGCKVSRFHRFRSFEFQVSSFKNPPQRHRDTEILSFISSRLSNPSLTEECFRTTLGIRAILSAVGAP
jgi:hypothetical protein